jgi:hypothetical protein
MDNNNKLILLIGSTGIIFDKHKPEKVSLCSKVQTTYNSGQNYLDGKV